MELEELRKILPTDYQEKGIRVQTNPMQLAAADAQRKFDELTLDVVIPIFNELVQKLEVMKIELRIPSTDIKGMRLNGDGVIEITKGNDIWQSTGSSGHLILDKDGTVIPQRSRMQFTDCRVTDEDGVTVVHGIIGPQGVQGMQGVQGIQGVQGKEGKVLVPTIDEFGRISWILQEGFSLPEARNIIGPQGVQGVQGQQGIQGIIGPQGVQGEQGTKGDRGEKGNQGEKGDIGLSGLQGPRGDQGEKGEQGERGIQGVPGVQGIQGKEGPLGSQGLKGDDGADGRSFTVQGLYPTLLRLQQVHPVGNIGDAYAIGTMENNYIHIWSNEMGDWENVGQLQGPTGCQGPQGAQGVQGIHGEQGLPGREGSKGDMGLKGEKGEKGEQGIQGLQGPAGIQGGKGEKGDQGIQGVVGPQGFIGIQGIQGVQGEKGLQGPQGMQGPQGNPSVVNGKSGPSITLTSGDIGVVDKTTHATYTWGINNGLVYLEQIT